MYHQNILGAIGNTPMVKINRITKDVKATVLAKVETFNPGNSIKDRMALKMIEDAEAAGILKPGGTIIEGTSGNTGMGLAIAAIVKGYKCIFTTTDKQSKEKVDALRAFGAEVIVCPTNVEPEDPRSYYSVAAQKNREIPNSFYPNQYDNPSNAKAHYETTGPEIWAQTEGKVDHFVVGVGTGGTISGVAKYLKEKNPNIKIIGVDADGSILKSYHETGEIHKEDVHPYQIEGMGKNLIPAALLFDKVDEFVRVNDEMSAYRTREIALKEAIMGGYTTGAVTQGLIQYAQSHELTENDLVVLIYPDHGSRYITKVYSDQWMAEQGFVNNCVHNYDEVFKTEFIK